MTYEKCNFITIFRYAHCVLHKGIFSKRSSEQTRQVWKRELKIKQKLIQMNTHLVIGSLYGITAQVITYLQLQGNVKYGWYQKYPIPLLLLSIPIAHLFIKSVDHFVKAYDGEVTPSRLIGFVLGMFVFMIMSWIMFKEPITVKTFVCLLLSASILVIQIWWK